MTEIERLVDQVAIVTGGGQGLGEGLAKRLDKEGCKIVVADLNFENAKKVSENLKNSIPCKVDISNESEVEEMINLTIKKYDKLDILISNAGILIAKSIVEFPSSEWKKMVVVNLFGYFLCAKYAAMAMIPNKKGNIIQINSKSGKKGSYKNSAYSASKFGGIGLTQSLALELAEYGIRVNSICPGNLFDSPLWKNGPNSLFEQYSKNLNLTVEQVQEKYLSQIPLRRSCSYEDVANVMVFLASDDSSYMTGQAINVTGGQEMR